MYIQAREQQGLAESGWTICRNVDDAVGRWIGPLTWNFIKSNYFNVMTWEPPVPVREKVWKRLSNDGELDMDVHFQTPGKTERHLKLRVRKLLFLPILRARLYDWLGPEPNEIWSRRGLLEFDGDNCRISDLPPPPIPWPRRRPPRRPRETRKV